MFRFCKNEQETKKLFRKLSLRLHPDHGGDNELMNLLNKTYEDVKEEIALGVYDEDRNQNIENAFSAFSPDEDDIEEGIRVSFEKVCEKIYKGDSDMQILDRIMEFTVQNKKFKNEFAQSVKEFFEERGFVTESQYNSLVKIYYQFCMEDYFREKNKKKTS